MYIGTCEAGRVPCQLPLHSSIVSFERKMAKSTFTRTSLGVSKGLDQGRPKVHGERTHHLRDLKTSIRRVLWGAGKKTCSSESSLAVTRDEIEPCLLVYTLVAKSAPARKLKRNTQTKLVWKCLGKSGKTGKTFLKLSLTYRLKYLIYPRQKCTDKR